MSQATGAGPIVPVQRGPWFEGGLQQLLDALPDSTAVVDPSGVIVAVNRAWRRFALDQGGSEAATSLGVNYLEVCERAAAAGCADAAVAASGLRAVLAGHTADGELTYSCPTPTSGRWFLMRVTPIDAMGSGALVSHVNVTRLKTAEQELQRKASHDPLTGLANRLLLHRKLNHALLPRPGARVADVGVLLIDLDGFKPVNDSFGHAAGDELLLEVAHRLREVVRPTDTVARLGGDEFVVVAPGVSSAALDGLVRRVSAALARPHQVHGQSLRIGASVGAHLAAPGDPPAAALAAADALMYDAKRAERVRV